MITAKLLPGTAACQGCPSTMCLRTVLEALDKAVLVVPASCTSVYMGAYPHSAINIPVFNCTFASAASTATGIKGALEFKGIDAEVVVWAGDGGTYDIGLQALSGAAERNEDILYICYNNEIYSNTGIQRSGATPYGAWTNTTVSGKREHRKDVAEILITHDVPYVATASAGYLRDLYSKVRKARKIKGFRYIEILAPCPPGWRFPMDRTVEVGRLAVETGMWILYEHIHGEFRFTGLSRSIVEGKRKLRDLRDYLRIQGRFSNLSDEEIDEIEKFTQKKWEKLKKLHHELSHS
ncbi:Pyruvate:ferredoxin oxidoreductase-related 2-oxoacid:ferredoxin oxidoreductase, beta subunit [Archaeoglobus sulfaticallidus PM70-1]|uniref:Pyruvate:ferredoxin oxidoreductase-related 2-oxoacid:ferredoxin oxidoreductase, beta subunit n=1 Tax=Archaeoglobus sulfaticallidus PM70-1 TaxID=387631 RepID=N0BK55_9EURY|nr:3-methyl-2-oxobutanoate dehydrogenase subunit beta [Archaeoglobus sulfaticallidus]AGK60886.1 Pyruvate:ferredoxin oxidoreductase-related 2-oxoacid:ferredoxin oxidoreductase, beta subunit [Archaeoglobus sulfaticallidus PM70-1]